jgi:DNA polymerase-3 subunit alpha
MLSSIGSKSDFSVKESILSTRAIVTQAAEHGYKAVALADTMSINGLTNLFSACKEKEIKGIIGATFRVVDDLGWRKAKSGEPKPKPNAFFMPKLWAVNEGGLQDIMNLLTLSTDSDHFYMQAQIDFADLVATIKKGNVVVTTGDSSGVFAHARVMEIAEKLNSVCTLHDVPLFVELCPVNKAYYDKINHVAYEWATDHGVKTILSRPAYNKVDQTNTRNTLDSILSRDKTDSMWRSEPSEDLHILNQTKLMYEAKAMKDRHMLNYGQPMDVRSAVEGTIEFPNLFDYEWKKSDISLPDMSTDPIRDLTRLCLEGWKKRITKPMMGYQPSSDLIPEYKERLKYELGVLKKMGFENYFLLVHKVVHWSKDNDIMVGPGRGSAGGSLVSFLLGITDTDPIRFGLIFERFINPDRLDLPDIDLDFMTSRRQEVITWLQETYGRDYVAGISNYGTFGSASALRQVASAHNIHESEYRCSKQIPDKMSLEEAMTATPDIESFAAKHPKVWEEACQLQGVFRNYGKHAAGVIVAGEPISKRAVVNLREDLPMVNWDKRTVEDWGLIKLDVLGLKTLDLLSHAKRYIKETTGNDIEYTDLPLDDPKVLQAFGRGDTAGIFQFESGGMRHLLKQLAEADGLTFDDVVATTALYRPGPMEAGLMELYVQIKQGAAFEEYLHESMRPALEPTMSVIIYQEQVMQLSRDLAGFSMSDADKLRKAMGKKDPVAMAKERDKWVDGCASKSGMDEKVSADLFNQIEKFAGYAFNLSHSVEYTVISYWSMYVKVNYPSAFYAASMTVLDTDKLPGLVKDAKKAGLLINPPDINLSSDRFTIGPDGVTLYAPFQSLKGLSANGAAAILEAKVAMGRPFESKAEFVGVVNRRLCNKTRQADLDAVGAFSLIEEQLPSLDPSRLKDQKVMLPGLMQENVKVDRKIKITEEDTVRYNQHRHDVCDVLPEAQSIIMDLIEDDEERDKAIRNTGTINPYTGAKMNCVIITDAPNYHEFNEGVMGEGKASSSLIKALHVNGISKEQVYITSLVKVMKPKATGIESMPNALINLYSEHLDVELDILKPPVIVCLGSNSIRYLCPDAKGGWEELAGKAVYDKDRDATIVWGFSPGMIFFEPSRQKLLNEVFAQVKELI